MSSNFDYEELSPNIRRVVRRLHDWGYETTDSGDGSQHKEGMGCAVPYPMVAIRYRGSLLDMVSYADLLHNSLIDAGVSMGIQLDEGEGPLNVVTRSVEVSYSTADRTTTMLLIGVSDSDLR